MTGQRPTRPFDGVERAPSPARLDRRSAYGTTMIPAVRSWASSPPSVKISSGSKHPTDSSVEECIGDEDRARVPRAGVAAALHDAGSKASFAATSGDRVGHRPLAWPSTRPAAAGPISHRAARRSRGGVQLHQALVGAGSGDADEHAHDETLRHAAERTGAALAEAEHSGARRTAQAAGRRCPVAKRPRSSDGGRIRARGLGVVEESVQTNELLGIGMKPRRSAATSVVDSGASRVHHHRPSGRCAATARSARPACGWQGRCVDQVRHRARARSARRRVRDAGQC